MKEELNEEIFIRELISKSKLEFPFNGLEDKIMEHVIVKSYEKAGINRDIRLSWIFFIAGSLFGTFISVVLPHFQEPVLGFSLSKLAVPFQILFILLFVNQLNILIDFYRRMNNAKHSYTHFKK